MKSHRINIFYTVLIDRMGKNITIGGIQNYLIGLSHVCMNKGFEVVVYQCADVDFQADYSGVKVIGKVTNPKDSHKKQIKTILKKVENSLNKDDILIFGTDAIAFKTKQFKRTISIQHGISFDFLSYHAHPKLLSNNFIATSYKILLCYRNLMRFLMCKNVVCVDYNFKNWVRTIIPRSLTENAVVIPNYAILSKEEGANFKNLETIKILFARRFESRRGVDILIETIHEISQRYKNVEFTICGDGPMKNILIGKLNDYKNVVITRYGIGESEKFNLEHHITFVPTFGSEGTSFSLLEGMAAGSVPVVSNVGGLTNIVLDGFNGFISEPKSSEFVKVISKLLDHPEQLKFISKNAKSTIEHSFSKDKWDQKWIEFIKSI
jgi:glycosyltransferase involved in cell wall biosynthesis